MELQLCSFRAPGETPERLNNTNCAYAVFTVKRYTYHERNISDAPVPAQHPGLATSLQDEDNFRNPRQPRPLLWCNGPTMPYHVEKTVGMLTPLLTA
jgi:hypothetical protein